MAQASLLSPSPQDDAISPESLAEHILAEITRTGGPQLPCYDAEEIVNGFLGRFSAAEVMAVCRQAFGVHGGMWRGAPVTVRRFRQSNDAYFALPLLEEARAARS